MLVVEQDHQKREYGGKPDEMKGKNDRYLQA